MHVESSDDAVFWAESDEYVSNDLGKQEELNSERYLS